jgi:microcystin-dependent protein
MPRILNIDYIPTPVGTAKALAGATTPTGWVLASGRTIGSASSGATERANADTKNLFMQLWNSFADAQLPVSGGRGGSALADFNANKTITLPDLRGRSISGKDDMGGSTAGRITNAGSGIVGTTLGANGGAETHTLTTAQLASHGHNWQHFIGGGGGAGSSYLGSGSTYASATQNTNATAAVVAAGSGNAHQNTQPSYILNMIIKL